MGIGPVVVNRDRLLVLQLSKDVLVKDEVPLDIERLRRGKRSLVGERFSKQETDLSVLGALGHVVVDLELVLLATELAGKLGAEVVRKGEEYLGPEGL